MSIPVRENDIPPLVKKDHGGNRFHGIRQRSVNKSVFSRYRKVFAIKPDMVEMPVIDLLEKVQGLSDVKDGDLA